MSVTVLMGGAVTVGELKDPISVRVYSDGNGRWAEATVALPARSTVYYWTLRYQIGGYPTWLCDDDRMHDADVHSRIPDAYRTAMRSLVFGLARMDFR